MILDLGEGEPRAEVIRVEYDVDRAVVAIRESDLPDDFADYLLTGGRPDPVGQPRR